MNRETAGTTPDSMKEDPRATPKAHGGSRVTLVHRLRQPPMIRMSCITQHANIRLIKHRGQFPCSFRSLLGLDIFKKKYIFILLL
jgi:hypothetical protein